MPSSSVGMVYQTFLGRAATIQQIKVLARAKKLCFCLSLTRRQRTSADLLPLEFFVAHLADFEVLNNQFWIGLLSRVLSRAILTVCAAVALVVVTESIRLRVIVCYLILSL